MKQWPKKGEREQLEISGFIAAYRQLPASVQFEVVRKGEMPDYVVRDVVSGQEYGVELTSVYIDDRSVPDVHMRDEPDAVWLPPAAGELERYRTRLIDAIRGKICKARKGYDRARPLILAVYVNEYASMYLSVLEVDRLVKRYDSVFEGMSPFSQIVFWNLPNSGVVCAKPSGKTV